jgi:hypothetical protein
VPKNWYTVPSCRRLSLHDEYLQGILNYSALNEDSARGNRMGLIAKCMPKTSCGNASGVQQSTKPAQRSLAGRLVLISEASVFEAPVDVYARTAGSSYHSNHHWQVGKLPATVAVASGGNTKSLAAMWTEAGISYATASSRDVKQVVVAVESFGDFAGPWGGGTNQNKSKQARRYSFPADQVFRKSGGFDVTTSEMRRLVDAVEQSQWSGNDEVPMDVVEIGQSGGNSSVRMNLRSVIEARDGFVLLSADYSQIELRILAHFSNDANLCAGFIEPTNSSSSSSSEQADVFIQIASKWLKRPIDRVTPEDRSLVKQVCYAQIYGCGAKLVAENAGVSVECASQWMRDFKASYPGVSTFMDQARRACQQHPEALVETLLGRKRELKGMHALKNNSSTSRTSYNNGSKVEFDKACRQVVNTICQGTAADLIKVL